MVLPEERYAEWKKGRLLYCCNQAWRKNGGLVLWNAIAICETLNISCLMGRHLTKGDSANQRTMIPFWSKDEYHLVLPRTCRNSKLSLDMRHTLEESGKKTYGRRHWGIAEDGRNWNPCSETFWKRSVNAPKIVKHSYSRSQMEESNCREEIRFWEHQPESGTTQTEEKKNKIFQENQTGLHQHHLSPDDAETRNDFWSISGNFIYRHHVEPRVKLHVPWEESFPIPDVTRAISTTLDVMLERRIDNFSSIEGNRDLSDSWTRFTRFTTLEEKPPDGFTWSGVRLTKKQTTSRHDHLCPEICGQTYGKICQKQRNNNKNKNGLSRNESLVTLKDCPVFPSLI